MANNFDACIQRQLSKFEDLWLEACYSWPPSGFTVDTNSKLTWTITASLKDADWASVARAIADIAQRWPWHTVYDIPQLHITIAGLGNPEYWMKRENDLNTVLKLVVAQYPSIGIRIQGINLLRNTLVVQIIDVEDKLRSIVEQLAQHIKAVDPDANFRPGIHSQVWWTSIARLRNP